MAIFSYPDIAHRAYIDAKPFPHACIDNGWDQSILTECASDINKFEKWDGEKNFYGSVKKRYCSNIDAMPASVRSVIAAASAPDFINWLERLTGEKDLRPDPYLEGGGIHSIGTGGFLKIHADFNWHGRLQLYRRLNVLLYLNDRWSDDWDGRIELFSDPKKDPEVSLLPVMNRMLIFTTDDASFHGHRRPLVCPNDVQRNSIALYYYSPFKPGKNFAKPRVDTDYRAASDEKFNMSLRARLGAFKKALIG